MKRKLAVLDILRYTGPGTDGPITNANRRSTGRG